MISHGRGVHAFGRRVGHLYMGKIHRGGPYEKATETAMRNAYKFLASARLNASCQLEFYPSCRMKGKGEGARGLSFIQDAWFKDSYRC